MHIRPASEHVLSHLVPVEPSTNWPAFIRLKSYQKTSHHHSRAASGGFMMLPSMSLYSLRVVMNFDKTIV